MMLENLNMSQDERDNINSLCDRLDRRKLEPEIQKIYRRVEAAVDAAFHYRNEAVGIKCALLAILSGGPSDISKRDAIYALAAEYAKVDELTFDRGQERVRNACTAEVARLVEKVKEVKVCERKRKAARRG